MEETKQRGVSQPWRNVKPENILLEVAMSSDKTTSIDYLVDPYLPLKQVVGFYGRGGTAKSSFLATLAAGIGEDASTLWISTEELNDWIRVRHIKTGGGDGTLFVVQAVATARDEHGRVIATDFDVYSHLEAAIQRAEQSAAMLRSPPRPVRLVVLDTAVALTTWGRSESPNDDKSVKRLMAFLKGLAEKFDLCIAVIGHTNKGKHGELSDMVAGSAAWINSPRQAFMHVRDQRGKDQFVVVTVKYTLTGFFAAAYESEPVHTLATRPDGNDSVLCMVQLCGIQWNAEQAREMADAAMGRDQEEDSADETMSSKQKGINLIVTTIQQLLAAGHAKVDRGMVADAIGRAPNTRWWMPAEAQLAIDGTVMTTLGDKGIRFYELKR